MTATAPLTTLAPQAPSTPTFDVPAVGGNVQVRRISPKLLRTISARAIKDGRIDLHELMVWKLVYGLEDPTFTEAEAREITRRFSLRTLQPIIDRIDTLSGTDEHLHGDDAPHAVCKLVEPAVLATAWLQRFPPAGSRGHAPRPATNTRIRASRRGTSRSSTSSADDPDGESEPPLAEADDPPLAAPRRPCDNYTACRQLLPADAPAQRHFCDTPGCNRLRARERQRKSRAARSKLPPRGTLGYPGGRLVYYADGKAAPVDGTNRTDDDRRLGLSADDPGELWLQGHRAAAEGRARAISESLRSALDGGGE